MEERKDSPIEGILGPLFDGSKRNYTELSEKSAETLKALEEALLTCKTPEEKATMFDQFRDYIEETKKKAYKSDSDARVSFHDVSKALRTVMEYDGVKYWESNKVRGACLKSIKKDGIARYENLIELRIILAVATLEHAALKLPGEFGHLCTQMRKDSEHTDIKLKIFDVLTRRFTKDRQGKTSTFNSPYEKLKEHLVKMLLVDELLFDPKHRETITTILKQQAEHKKVEGDEFGDITSDIYKSKSFKERMVDRQFDDIEWLLPFMNSLCLSEDFTKDLAFTDDECVEFMMKVCSVLIERQEDDVSYMEYIKYFFVNAAWGLHTNGYNADVETFTKVYEFIKEHQGFFASKDKEDSPAHVQFLNGIISGVFDETLDEHVQISLSGTNKTITKSYSGILDDKLYEFILNRLSEEVGEDSILVKGLQQRKVQQHFKVLFSAKKAEEYREKIADKFFDEHGLEKVVTELKKQAESVSSSVIELRERCPDIVTDQYIFSQSMTFLYRCLPASRLKKIDTIECFKKVHDAYMGVEKVEVALDGHHQGEEFFRSLGENKQTTMIAVTLLKSNALGTNHWVKDELRQTMMLHYADLFAEQLHECQIYKRLSAGKIVLPNAVNYYRSLFDFLEENNYVKVLRDHFSNQASVDLLKKQIEDHLRGDSSVQKVKDRSDGREEKSDESSEDRSHSADSNNDNNVSGSEGRREDVLALSSDINDSEISLAKEVLKRNVFFLDLLDRFDNSEILLAEKLLKNNFLGANDYANDEFKQTFIKKISDRLAGCYHAAKLSPYRDRVEVDFLSTCKNILEYLKNNGGKATLIGSLGDVVHLSFLEAQIRGVEKNGHTYVKEKVKRDRGDDKAIEEKKKASFALNKGDEMVLVENSNDKQYYTTAIDKAEKKLMYLNKLVNGGDLVGEDDIQDYDDVRKAFAKIREEFKKEFKNEEHGFFKRFQFWWRSIWTRRAVKQLKRAEVKTFIDEEKCVKEDLGKPEHPLPGYDVKKVIRKLSKYTRLDDAGRTNIKHMFAGQEGVYFDPGNKNAEHDKQYYESKHRLFGKVANSNQVLPETSAVAAFLCGTSFDKMQ